ncbi:MAG TPA: carboxypeptidase-like regulatory domain-containing protein [Bacteroidota bacterium]|nr:carboxypeptidase-like regulatory domain-containing protein [Bacteroidota bacterium]
MSAILLLLPQCWKSELAAQVVNAGFVRGIVTSSETGESIENAIVYIPNSAIGTSTGVDGRFTLHRLPPGDYDLAVSRVGFHREKRRVTLGEGDTLDLEISLTPRPVQSPGVEVRAEREGGSTGPPLFFPDGGERSWCAYGSETEIPVGILFAGRTMYMYALESTPIGEEKFIRLWLLVYNGSEDTMTFDAVRDIRLTMKTGGKSYHNVRPDPSPANTLRNTDTSQGEFQPRAVERTLSVMASQSAFFIAVNLRFDWAGGGPWLGIATPPEHPSGVNPRHLKEIYDKCSHDGILKQYRIFPASGVDGFIRFPFPGFQATGSGTAAGREYTSTYEFVLQTPSGEERIVFTAH